MQSDFQADDEDVPEAVRQLRSEPRQSMLLMASVRRPGGADVAVKIRNISPGGMMAECPGGFARGEAMVAELRGVGTVPGRIAWVSAGRIGVAFDGPIDPRRARVPVASPVQPQLVQTSHSTWRPGLR